MIGESSLKANGKEVANWELTINNGPRDNRWNSLPAGDHLEFTYAMGAPDFRAPGTYDVVWVVQGHASKPFRIEVATEPTNTPARVTISLSSRPPEDKIIVTSSNMVARLVTLFPGYESQPANAFSSGHWPVSYTVDIAFADGHSRRIYVSANNWTAGAEHYTPIAGNWDEFLESMTTNFFKRTWSNMQRLDQVHEPTTLIIGPRETVKGP
jgi:hypothetical protein